MILRVLKYCSSIYLLLAAMLMGISRTGYSWEAMLFLLGLFAAITVLGLFIGWAFSLLVRKPRYNGLFYGVGQVVAFGFICIPFLNGLFSC